MRMIKRIESATAAAATMRLTIIAILAASRFAFASSAHCCSSVRIVESSLPEVASQPDIHEVGKVMRDSAYSSDPTPGTV